MFRLYHAETWPVMKSMPAYVHSAKAGKAGDAAEAAPPYEYEGFPAHLAERLGQFRSVSPTAILAKLSKYEFPYTELGREKFCILCLALIERGVAPGLLDLPRRWNDPKDLTDEQKTESNDRQVLDIYWLFRQRRASLIPKGTDFRSLFEGETFDFEWASEIVSKKGLARYKADRLTLHRGLELELMVLRTPETWKFLQEHRRRRDRMGKLLSARASKPRSKIDRADIPKYLNEFKCLDLANGSPKRAAELWSMMTGDPFTPQLTERLRNRRRWLEGEMGILFKSEGDERS